MLIQLTEPTPTKTSLSLQGIAIGIDLGTTHSVVAVSQDSRPKAIANVLACGKKGKQEPTIVPSVVAYTDEGVLVGRDAEKHPHAIRSIKRFMGRAQDFTDIDGSNHSPIEISSEILRALKQQVEQVLSQVVTQAVITVPAYFDEAARQETKKAAQLAGLEVLRLINEPTAAALAYGLDQGVEGAYAVYDLGGGTFDISIIQFTKGIFQVIATAGDTQLGGDDIDQAIANDLRIKYPHQKVTPPMAREMKEALSTQQTTDMAGVILDQSQLQIISEPFLRRTLDICQQAIQDSGLTMGDLQGVILVGGSTKMPLVRQMVSIFFKQDPLTNLNPDEVVALGAAIQAEALTRGSETLLLDVTPLSLGVETMGGLMEKIIHRNSPIPVAIAQEFTTYQDGQTAMIIHVLQGEREFVRDCRSLAQFTLNGIPPMASGTPRIRITFNLDVDGLLTVSAKEMLTGIEQSVDTKPSYGLSEAVLLQILRDNYEKGADDIETRLLVENRVHAEQFLVMLETAIAEAGDLLTEEETGILSQESIKLRNLLNSDDKNVIMTQLKQLEQLSHPFAEKRINRSIQRALTGQQV